MAKRIHDLEFPEELYDAVFIAPEQIKEEFARVPSDLAYWNARFAEAAREAQLAKGHVKQVRARLFIEYRERLRSEDSKVTDTLIDAYVENDPQVIDANLNAVETEAERMRLYGHIDSIRSKRDMLVSLGSVVRSEMEHDPVIKSDMTYRSMRKRTE